MTGQRGRSLVHQLNQSCLVLGMYQASHTKYSLGPAVLETKGLVGAERDSRARGMSLSIAHGIQRHIALQVTFSFFYSFFFCVCAYIAGIRLSEGVFEMQNLKTQREIWGLKDKSPGYFGSPQQHSFQKLSQSLPTCTQNRELIREQCTQDHLWASSTNRKFSTSFPYFNLPHI